MRRQSPKFVDSPHYHLWTDALHGRALAREAKNKWDRGTYVRWTVVTAWTVFERACEDALGAHGIGNRFRCNLDSAIARKCLPPLDWSRGTCQQVIEVQKNRKDYVHVRIAQEDLFAEVDKADRAIHILRKAMKAIYVHARKEPPIWLDDDDDRGWERGETSSVISGYISEAGVEESTPDVVRITYLRKGTEHPHRLCRPGTDPQPLVDELIRNILVPITAVRAYKGRELIVEKTVNMRGA